MLQRVNIHLKNSLIKELDKLAEQATMNKARGAYDSRITRADLIRFAISRTFGLPYSYVHIGKEGLWNIIRKVKKNLPKD